MKIRNRFLAIIKRIREKEDNELKLAFREASMDEERMDSLGVWESLDAEGWD